MMEPLLWLIKAEQQLCYGHGINLAVCDFLYSKAPNSSEGMYLNEDNYFTDAEIQDDDAMTELNGEIHYPTKSIRTP